ncbi:hypothetical protein AVEN_194535-1 [Araneus ventricosus]|uniref:Uncharacterized protein n=1 Tax=Araneus ventricosus TaxID=182803 RepID=A0A4Y2A630_ARAVE|nr:hypothetical protein AVEN_194535-1 [Araneus ventricosus]
MLKYLSPVRVVSRRIRGPYHANCTRPIPSQSLHQLNFFLLTNRVYGLMMLSPYSYTCIRPIQLETRLVRPGNVFPVISSPMVVLSDPGEA